MNAGTIQLYATLIAFAGLLTCALVASSGSEKCEERLSASACFHALNR